MEKIIFTINEKKVLSDSNSLTDECWWSGEEQVYILEDGEMVPLSDTYTTLDDNYRYFIPSDVSGWLNNEERETAPHVTVDDVDYIEITNLICFDDTVLTLEHGIRSEKIVVDSCNYDVDVERIDVDIELVETIPQDYPRQEFVRIYRGKDEDGNDIEVRETHPFFEDDAYPICEVTKFTYDVEFNDDNNTNSKGWKCSYEECLDYIRDYNGTNESYFEDYKGGTVSIRCNETEEVVYEENII